MKLKGFVGAAAALFAAAVIGTGVCAEDYTFDVSAAVESDGNWGQSFKEMTPQGGDINNAENFDPCSMTPDSEIIAEFSIPEDAIVGSAPVELIWQTWDGPFDPDPNVKSEWNKVAAYSYTRDTAKFSYNDIVTAYGTSDFSTVYAICIGDTGSSVLLTSLTVTNIDPDRTYLTVREEKENGTFEEYAASETQKAETASEETDAQTEAAAEETAQAATEEMQEEVQTVEETEAAAETAPVETTEPGEQARRIASAAPRNGTDYVPVVIIVVMTLVFVGIGAGLYIYLKRNKKI